MRVLIVEDNASMRTLLVTLLGSQGYTIVGQLENGNTLLDDIRRLEPTIVCLDYQLPGRDGLELLKDVNSNFPEIDVVFMTGSEDADIDKRAADNGASGFLRKPFGQKQILDELRQVYEVRQQAERADTPPAANAAPATPGVRRAGGRPTAVIVDDNSSIRLLLKGVLTELGMNIVAQAGNGEEAVRAAQTHQPQVLFLDVNMPLMSGLDALPKIREISPNTAVVMVTGDTSRELVQQAAGLGARGYIVKPVRPAYVEAFLKKLLNR
ncbi:response regulator [Azonexus hydrophilus]|jgi:DNA-binding NarL/FixJ family response regulator|uniref:Response regulator n=1 Tax=Azonexus hydrophilus TaxID=418702 RepID=A0ABZ2XNL3_9RHOO|nr:response regulator [Azonexus hydrophilus]MBS4020636.1 response regulator [Dechloromonas sp.]